MARELDRPRKYREAADMDSFGRFLVNECSPLRRRIVADIDVLLMSQQKEKALAAQNAKGLFNKAIGMVSALTILAITLGLAFSWGITRDCCISWAANLPTPLQSQTRLRTESWPLKSRLALATIPVCSMRSAPCVPTSQPSSARCVTGPTQLRQLQPKSLRATMTCHIVPSSRLGHCKR